MHQCLHKELIPVEKNTLLFSIIIPAYNEATNIVDTVPMLSDALRAESIPFELIVDNDNSLDETGDTLDIQKSSEWTTPCRVVSDSPNDVIHCNRTIEEG